MLWRTFLIYFTIITLLSLFQCLYLCLYLYLSISTSIYTYTIYTYICHLYRATHFSHSTLSSKSQPSEKIENKNKNNENTPLSHSPTSLNFFILNFFIQDFLVPLEFSQISSVGIPFLAPTVSSRMLLSPQNVHLYSYGCIYISMNTSVYPYINISISIYLIALSHMKYPNIGNYLKCIVFTFIYTRAHIFIEVLLYSWGYHVYSVDPPHYS